MSKMYKKHYDLIANTIANMDDIFNPNIQAIIAIRFANALAGTSPDYDAKRFLIACAGTPQETQGGK